jgi:metal-responsive CopG/Arc/MetJ family transcriptional regulator
MAGARGTPGPGGVESLRMNAPLRVPPALLRELEKIAAESRRDVSELTADALRQFVRSHRETKHLTRSRANLRRLRAAHTEIEAELARRRG